MAQLAGEAGAVQAPKDFDSKSKGGSTPYHEGGGSNTKVKNSGTSGGGGGGGTSGGGGGGGVSGAEARAIARENKAKRAAAKRFRDQADVLEQQISALKINLSGGFKKALDKRLANVALVSSQQDAALLEGYGERIGSLKGASEDNEKAANDSGFSNLANRGRERASAISEALSQGAGESDVLRAQGMSLRNWEANQSEVLRSQFDTLRTINSSLADLNVDTKTGRLNIESQANADRDQLWTQFRNQMAESWTQYGNLRGQQAELYGMANEQVSSATDKSKQKKMASSSGAAFKNAQKNASAVWANPGNSKALTDWEGEDDFEGANNASKLANAATNIAAKPRPEGATLRKW